MNYRLFTLAASLSLAICVASTLVFANSKRINPQGAFYVSMPVSRNSLVLETDQKGASLYFVKVGLVGAGFRENVGDCIGGEFGAAGQFWIGTWIVETPAFEIINWNSDNNAAVSGSIRYWLLALLASVLPLTRVWSTPLRRALGQTGRFRLDETRRFPA